MSIISKKIAGILAISGLGVILALNLVFFQPITTSLALMIGLFLAVLFLYQPKWGLLMFLLIRPLIDKFSEELSINIREDFTLNLAALLGALIVGLCFLFFLKNGSLLRQTYLLKPWFFYISIVVLSIVFSINPSATFYEIIRLVSIASVFTLAFAISKKEKDFLFIIYAVLISAIVPFLTAFYQLLTKTGLGGTAGIESRIFGTFSHPNSFAAFVLLVFASSLYLIFRDRFPEILNKKYLFHFIALFSLLILVGTFSRGAWLALLIFALILSIFKSPKLILATGALLVILFFSSDLVHDRIEDIYNPPASSSIHWRFKQWDKMFEVYKNRPLTGYGAGTETLVHEREFGFYAGNPYTHNDLLRSALETGLFGALAFSFLMLSTGFYLFKKYRLAQTPSTKTFLLIVFALFVAEFAFSMTSNIFRGTAIQWPLWALIGSALALPINKKVSTK